MISVDGCSIGDGEHSVPIIDPAHSRSLSHCGWGKDHKLQVSGPTGAMTVALVLIVAAHGAGGVLTVRLHMGPLQVGPVVARAGRCMR